MRSLNVDSDLEGPLRNRILRGIRREDRQRILSHLTSVEWQRGEMVYETCAPQRYAYFPVDSLVSITHFLEDGHSCEIAVIGNDGMLGISIFTQTMSMPEYAVVQAAGSAYRLKASVLKDEANRCESFRLLLRYTQVLLTQISQSATCNRYHTITQQLARWLLIAIDHLPQQQLQLTQEQIAHSLGVRREGVTEAAGRLQKAGLIEYRRGRINVINRAGLERVCCECYKTVKRETERLLPD
ncbi:Crp/Fnr family transcriptional regulator [Wenzhouxiangella sp. AB-CW3]|nr:Crp/Fnr family transcriptional regulator [Wenzhouxiangella sp. AB-CW3]